MPTIQAMASRIVSAAWCRSATWLIAAGTCTHCKDHQRPSGSASTVYTGFPNRCLPFRGVLVLHIQPTASADETGLYGCGTYCLRVASRGACFMGAAGQGPTVGGRRCAPWVSAGGARRICCRRLSDGMSPSWVAAVAVAQEYRALFFSGVGPVQGRGKMLLVRQCSDMAPRRMSRRLWDIWILLRPGGGEIALSVQEGGVAAIGSAPRVQALPRSSDLLLAARRGYAPRGLAAG